MMASKTFVGRSSRTAWKTYVTGNVPHWIQVTNTLSSDRYDRVGRCSCYNTDKVWLTGILSLWIKGLEQSRPNRHKIE